MRKNLFERILARLRPRQRRRAICRAAGAAATVRDCALASSLLRRAGAGPPAIRAPSAAHPTFAQTSSAFDLLQARQIGGRGSLLLCATRAESRSIGRPDIRRSARADCVSVEASPSRRSTCWRACSMDRSRCAQVAAEERRARRFCRPMRLLRGHGLRLQSRRASASCDFELGLDSRCWRFASSCVFRFALAQPLLNAGDLLGLRFQPSAGALLIPDSLGHLTRAAVSSASVRYTDSWRRGVFAVRCSLTCCRERLESRSAPDSDRAPVLRGFALQHRKRAGNGARSRSQHFASCSSS